MEIRSSLAALTLAFGLAMPNGASAADSCDGMFANQRFTIIVPNRAGGGYDAYARALAPAFEKLTGSTVVVVNNPAAGGMVGVAAVADAKPEDNTLGVFGTTKVFATGETSIDPSTLQALASFAVDSQSWMARKGAKLEDYIGASLIGGVSTIDTQLTRQVLVAKSLGSKIRLVAGYGGSVDTDAALLRGEIDYTTGTVQSGELNAGEGDFQFLFTLTDYPLTSLKDVPYLAGTGGIVDRITADKPMDVRDEAMKNAQLAVDLNEHMRAIFASSRLQGERRDCLARFVGQAVETAEFKEAMSLIGRPVEFMDYQAATKFYDRLSAAYAQSADLIESLRGDLEN